MPVFHMIAAVRPGWLAQSDPSPQATSSATPAPTSLPETTSEEVVIEAEKAVEDATEAVADAATKVPEYLVLGIRIAAILLIAFLVSRLIRRVIRRFEVRIGGEDIDVSKDVREKRAQTLGSLLRGAAAVVVWGAALLIVLEQSGVSIGPLLAAAGVGGLAVGFGAQTLVRDVISGFFVLLEDQYHVGDVVELAGVGGVVEHISLRTTVLRDLTGKRHVVPNGEVRVSTNLTKGFSRYLIELPVPYDHDIDAAVKLVEETADNLRRDPQYAGDILGPLVVLGVDAYADSQVNVKIYLDTRPGRQWAVGREFRRRIKYAYDKAGISIPFPHREVIVKSAASADNSSGAGV